MIKSKKNIHYFTVPAPDSNCKRGWGFPLNMTIFAVSPEYGYFCGSP